MSIIGIWPRFIEPNLLFTTRLSLPIAKLPEDLEGLKIAQFSDLHLQPDVPDHFLDRLFRKIQHWEPDLVVFTGDFLCYSKMSDPIRLKSFLSRFNAPLGCYTIFGNHDYQSYVAVNAAGDYDIVESVPGEISKGFRRVLSKQKVTGVYSPRLGALQPNAELTSLLAGTPFELLDNRTIQIPVKKSALNLTGVGEYMASHFDPDQAFRGYDTQLPGIVLAHNPDCLPRLEAFPGDVILCGHLHGGQINLPWVRGRFVVLENPNFVRGTFRYGNKWVHISRGLGGTLRFRFRASPELTLITLSQTGASV